MEKTKIILDTDIGDDIDDALALSLILASPELELLGVTTVFGNVDLRAKLACYLLSAFKREEIPVFTGADLPLIEPRKIGLDFHQARIFPDSYQPEYRDGAVGFICEKARELPGQIELVAVGPLTNVALALRSDPSLKKNLKGITLMGGQIKKPGAEWNIICDPEAAQIVFTSGVPIKMVGLDVTDPCKLTEEELKILKENKLMGKLVELWQAGRGWLPIPHDPLAVAAVFNDKLITWEQMKILVELQGSYMRGQTTVHSDGTVQVATEVRRNDFIELFLQRLATLPNDWEN
ncbi:MAG TPA: nucleoside hydrolase [Bacillota bacterium]|nr:nucleoside hydrolase [Bacillota bacterium]